MEAVKGREKERNQKTVENVPVQKNVQKDKGHRRGGLGEKDPSRRKTPLKKKNRGEGGDQAFWGPRHNQREVWDATADNGRSSKDGFREEAATERR